MIKTFEQFKDFDDPFGEEDYNDSINVGDNVKVLPKLREHVFSDKKPKLSRRVLKTIGKTYTVKNKLPIHTISRNERIEFYLLEIGGFTIPDDCVEKMK